MACSKKIEGVSLMRKNKIPKYKIYSFFLFFSFILFSVLWAQTKKEKKYPPAKHYRVYEVIEKIKIDGILDEKDWKKAEIIKLPYEWLPGDNIPAPVETDCMVTFSKTHLYIAFRCYDPNPKKIRAHLMDRDATDTLIQDDHIVIMIDAFNDERRGFQFRVNPLGVQADANFSELEGYEDFSWDAIWKSAGKITEFGYIVEIAIPFNQLRFTKTEKSQTWGFSAERSYPRTVRHRTISHVRARDRNCILCQLNKLHGFKGMSPGKNLEFDPTLTVNRTDTRSSFPSGEMKNGSFNVEPGITARWGITSNVILNGTINPDFSQIEADVAQLEVNTRFALRYPEKRPFFLEGADFFLTPLEAIFTRTIYNPLWGVKLTSKFDKNAVGIFATQDRYNNLTFPSNQGSLSNSMEKNIYTGVVRYRRDMGKGSTVGVLYSGRVGDNYHNHVAGVDGFLRLTKTKNLNFQYLYSNTLYPKDISKTFNQKEDSFGGSGLKINFNHRGRNLIYDFEYLDKSPNFRADSGFIPRVDVRRFNGLIIPIIWGKRGGWFNQITFPIVASYTIDYNGTMTDMMFYFEAGYQGPLQSIANTGVQFSKEKYGEVTYDISRFHVRFAIKPIGGIHFNIFSRVGDSIDYSNSRLAKSLLIIPALEWGIGKHLNLNINHTFERLSLTGKKIYTVNLSQAKIIYNFNIRTFVRVIVQYTHIDRNTDNYIIPVDPVYKGVFTQLLFSYKINPQTVLFIGYSDNHMGLKGIDITQTNRTFFLKIGYALVM